MKSSHDLLLILISLLFTGCINSIGESDELYNDVTFKVNINSAINDFPESRSNISGVKSIDCFFSLNNKLYKTVSQKDSDEDFGIISQKLDEGTYDVFIIGHNSQNISLSPDLSHVSFDKVSDSFLYTGTIEVNDDFSESVILKRIVGKMEIVAFDAVPGEANSIKLTLYNTHEKLNIITKSGYNESSNVVREWTYSDSNKGMKNTTYSIYSFVPESYNELCELKIEVYDKDNNIIASHEIPKIEFIQNKIVRYSGNLFTNQFMGNIILDYDWEEVINKDF